MPHKLQYLNLATTYADLAGRDVQCDPLTDTLLTMSVASRFGKTSLTLDLPSAELVLDALSDGVQRLRARQVWHDEEVAL